MPLPYRSLLTFFLRVHYAFLKLPHYPSLLIRKKGVELSFQKELHINHGAHSDEREGNAAPKEFPKAIDFLHKFRTEKWNPNYTTSSESSPEVPKFFDVPIEQELSSAQVLHQGYRFYHKLKLEKEGKLKTSEMMTPFNGMCPPETAQNPRIALDKAQEHLARAKRLLWQEIVGTGAVTDLQEEKITTEHIRIALEGIKRKFFGHENAQVIHQTILSDFSHWQAYFDTIRKEESIYTVWSMSENVAAKRATRQ